MSGIYVDVPDLDGGNVRCEKRQKNEKTRPSEPPETAPFFGTDVESIGDTSTVPSAPAVRTPQKHRESHQAEPEPGTSPLKSDEEFETDDEERADCEAAGQQHASQRQRDIPLGRGRNRDQVARAWRTIKGDSYPTTTDGVPSESDCANNAAQDLTRESTRKRGVAQHPQTPGIRQRGRFPAAAPLPTTANLRPPSNQQGHALNKSGSVPSNASVSPHEDADINRAPPSQHFASTSAVAAASGPDSAISTHQHNLKINKPPDRSPAAQNTVASGSARYSVLQVNSQKAAQPSIALELPSGTSTKRAISPISERQREQAEEVELDYDRPELYTMQYSTVKAATFDDDPRADDFTPLGDSLEDKLAAAVAQGAEYQERLFATLNITQWEDAGDWFLGRFGDVVDRLKRARREKRAAARKIEDSVERRHDAVSKKRKITEDALLSMKRSGKAILDSTPKKAREG